MFRFFGVAFIFVFAQQAFAQKTFLHARIQGLKTPFVILGNYDGGKAFRLDSIGVDTMTGVFFVEKEKLAPGVYFCTSTKGKLFDFLVPNPADSIDIRGNLANIDSLWSRNSPENEAFFRFEQYRKSLENQIETKKSMRNMIGQATHNDPAAVKPINADLDALYLAMDSLALGYVKKYPGHLFSKMLRSVRPPEPPPALKPLLKNGAPNPNYARWQRQHYWDNTDFRDESLLRNTFWNVYFDNFFSRHVTTQVDSMLTAIDEVLAKTPRNGAYYRFIVSRISQYYEQNEAPGADRIFVHMVDKYLKKEDTPWIDKATLERLAYKADVHRPNLTGSLAVNFTMPDEMGNPVELYGINAPMTVLIFYSPLCSHCMEVMPNIYQTWLEYKPKGIAAIAVADDDQPEYWRKFVKQQNWEWLDVADPKIMVQLDKQYGSFNLPVIYLLDKDKRILAKRIKPNELGAVLGNMLAKK